ncbi:hypothetical protein [Streptosporangium lutulentum]|uniref:Uncharacterized protein n=1 Tax=Streptosporangium lutulentum TaxID=1461250 RepID=A0ABT9Q9J7_9ACTN|nr:hypothetical protein [Streptosporangium lutulentum]MDP9843337.1 hypothetical protein [Streptosporangium lutulentum]
MSRTSATATRKGKATKAEPQAAPSLRTKRRQDKPTLGTRITYHTNERLTAANEHTGLGISGIVEAALIAYLDFLGIPPDAKPPLSPDGTRPKRERSIKKRTRRSPEEIDDQPIAPRISHQTNDRLTVACIETATGPQDIVETALKAWLRKQNIPLYPETPGERRAPKKRT